MYNHLSTSSSIRELVNHPALKGIGELLLLYDNNSRYYNTLLRNVGSLMPYHSHVEPEIVVDAINHMIDDSNDSNQYFSIFFKPAKE